MELNNAIINQFPSDDDVLWVSWEKHEEAEGWGQHHVYGILSLSIHTIFVFLVMVGLASRFNCFPSPDPDLDPS